MKITATDKLSDIQKIFNDKYQYLKLEFFSKPHGVGVGSPKRDILDTDLTIDECSTKDKEGTISIEPNVKAAEVEQNFLNSFGISAQVFRLSRDVWLETTSTDHWTLEEQNNLGEEATA